MNTFNVDEKKCFNACDKHLLILPINVLNTWSGIPSISILIQQKNSNCKVWNVIKKFKGLENSLLEQHYSHFHRITLRIRERENEVR